jgi:hypothetical protein
MPLFLSLFFGLVCRFIARNNSSEYRMYCAKLRAGLREKIGFATLGHLFAKVFDVEVSTG